ncbi:hypothetical protein [Haloferula rosea]|uniref:GLUG domain-containing protein n=1 Tax=Haloferula rosea TaxID=490093 RepID=A0A934RAK7_9BACT|nr:hypothetical protein [Haloferula rosea]MBK1828179.1 hypothetical protein [Haloferula rosea]
MKRTRKLLLAGALAIPTISFAADVEITTDVTENTTWTKDNEYILKKPIFVTNDAELTIEPGTTIYGTEDTVGGTFGSLVVTRGAKLWANGTCDEPIVFTALEERDGPGGDPGQLPLDPEFDASYWGGVILLGDAPINFYDGNVQQTENEIEGFPTGLGQSTLYGGSDATDNSGALTYVSIRWGGFEFSPGKEINGLTLGGVGSETTIENVEIFANSDDGLEIFGGTVNTKRIAVAFCWDESFDLDEGHVGYHQFWFAIQNADGSVGDKLGEWDGGNGTPDNSTPFSLHHIHNATLIGGGVGVNNGIEMKDNYAGTLSDSVISEAAIALGDQDDGVGSPKPTFQFNTWGNFSSAGLQASIGGAGAGDPAGSDNGAIGVDIKLRGISRVADGGLDPRPQADSPLLGAPLAGFPGGAPAGFFETVDYRGAFGTDTTWLDGWSYLSQAGYLGEVCNDVEVTADITTSTTWTNDKCYILRKPIFVTNNAVLTIEPGTTIYGTEDTVGGTFGSLIITRGAQIMAEGTCEQPIVFTALEERDGPGGDPGQLPLDPEFDASYWGGVILLGDAPINFYDGNVQQTENEIEGFPTGLGQSTLYGGNDATDNSGVLTYVSIRWGGFEFSPGKEINGLTLGGVGSETTIENVEIFANSDDGLEIFGGTVNTKRIAVAFCWDESFDLDEGHVGHHQFWFAIQNADGSVGDKLGEWDGGNGTPDNATPFSLHNIYNATLIGGGVGVNNGIEMKDNYAGTLSNSVISEAAVALGDQDDGVGSPKPTFQYNTWGNFTSAGLQSSIGGGTAADPAGSNNGVIGVDPKFTGISRIADGGLDPRPAIDSPLRGASLASFPAVAPLNFYETVDYRGAFGDTNWLWGWSYLYKAGYLSAVSKEQIAASKPSEDTGGGTPPFADSDNDGISDTLEGTQELADLGFTVGSDDSGLFSDFSTSQQLLDIDYFANTINGTGSILTLQLEGSTTLGGWTFEQDVNVPLPSGTKFYRFTDGN